MWRKGCCRSILAHVALVGCCGLSPIVAPPSAAAGTPAIRGYPVVLASGSGGGVWYGGATSRAAEYVERIDYITPTGAFEDFQFSAALSGHWPDYLAAGEDGREWFLAHREGSRVPLLAEVSPLGEVSVHEAPFDPASTIRGLAVGSDGNLWTTATGTHGLDRVSAILRITPQGKVTAFADGLRKGAIPENIAAGPDGALWFTDAVGRIGRITTAGAIEEFPVGQRITMPSVPFAPARPIVAGAESVWFIVSPRLIGRVTLAGRVKLYRPRSSYSGVEASGDRGALVGLAAAADGTIWFTRESGEVARIDGTGRVRTITNRLLAAYGIAFDAAGVAWIGEGPRYDEGEGRETPARVARLTAAGDLHQFPPRPVCHIPSVLGMERPFALALLNDELTPGCRVSSGRVRILGGGRGQLIAVAQSPRAGSPTEGYARVSFVLKRESPKPPPRTCRAPSFFKVLVRSSRLVVWKAVDGGPDESSEAFYACVPPHGVTRTIASTYDDLSGGTSLEQLTHAGSTVAYVLSSGSKYGGDQRLVVQRVPRGRKLSIATDDYDSGYVAGAESPKLPRLERTGQPVGRGVHGLALDSRGDVAWLGTVSDASGKAQELVLYLHDGCGLHRVAAGPAISGLTLRGGALSWTDGGVAHSMKSTGC